MAVVRPRLWYRGVEVSGLDSIAEGNKLSRGARRATHFGGCRRLMLMARAHRIRHHGCSCSAHLNS